MSINVDPNTLNYYVQNAQIPLAELKDKIPNLDKYLAGEQQPTFNQLSEIAKKINIPTGLLMLKRKVEVTNQRLEFRKLHQSNANAFSENLRDTIIDMQDKQEFLRNEIDYTLDFIGRYNTDSDPMMVAKHICAELDIEPFFQKDFKDIGKVIEYLRTQINNIGVFVFANGKIRSNNYRPLNIEEFRGFVLSDDKAPIIFVNQKDSKTGQVFTIIHELVHLFIGCDEIFTTVETDNYEFDKVEAFVNKVTAEILVPADIFLAFKSQDIAMLAKQFYVSEYVIARRLLTLNQINKATYQAIIHTLDQNRQQSTIRKKEKNGGDYNNNIKFMMDKKFLGYIAQAINQHRISYTDAFGIMGVGYKGYQTLVGKNKLEANHG